MFLWNFKNHIQLILSKIFAKIKEGKRDRDNPNEQQDRKTVHHFLTISKLFTVLPDKNLAWLPLLHQSKN